MSRPGSRGGRGVLCTALAIWLTLAGSSTALAASGSWMMTLPRQSVAASDSPLRGHRLDTPAHVKRGTITQVHWSFSVEGAVTPLLAWVCQGGLCVPLPSTQGSTNRFQGRSVDDAFRLEFWYPSTRGASGRAIVTGARMIVDFDA